MNVLVPYDQARIMLAEAKSVDDVKQIHDKAAAMAEYQRRAGDKTLQIDAIEIRMYAQRRLGQMLAAQKETVGLNRGAAGGGTKDSPRGTFTEPRDTRPRLADAGISKKLSSQAQKIAVLPPEQFEAKLSSWREEALLSERVTSNLLEIGREDEQRAARRDLARMLSDTSADLAGQRKVPCIYADPAWRRKAGIGDRAYENHFPTMTWDEIMALPVKDLMLPDAWLFLWLPRAHLMALHKVKMDVVVDGGEVLEGEVRLPLAWAIACAWGCDEYSTCFIWTKTDEEHEDDVGMGLVVRDQDEVLCLFKKGRGLPKPASHEKFGSNHRERSKPLGHSRKPQFYREMIASMTGGLPVLELFAREDKEFPLPENWATWGNESESQANADVEAAVGESSEAAVESVSRPADGRSSAATSEIRDATAGETASNSTEAAA